MITAIETMLNVLTGGLALALMFALVSMLVGAVCGFRDAWRERERR